MSLYCVVRCIYMHITTYNIIIIYCNIQSRAAAAMMFRTQRARRHDQTIIIIRTDFSSSRRGYKRYIK